MLSSRYRSLLRRLVLLAATLGVLTGCTVDAGDGAGGGTTEAHQGGGRSGASTTPAAGTSDGVIDPDDIDPGRLEPLAGLGPCPNPPEAVEGADAGELPLPDQAVVTTGSSDGGLRNAQGYSPRTPVEIMVGYLRRDGWTVLAAEDEVFESEVLLEKDGLRVFAKSQATCERGSAFVLFGSDDPALVPAPAGGTP